MTRVTLRVHYSSRTATGRPGQTVDLEDGAAQRLISAGRATLTTTLPADDEDQAPDPEPKRKASGAVRAVRTRRGKQNDDEHTLHFYDPDRASPVFDPTRGRKALSD
ncbi:hypothetical protein ACH4LS_22645 [Streptomyces luteogriseus]|uniref:hypothetical protein n=1 Tax=Streptomyces luteogriseus TaxID=68233 RepID=UPI0037B2FD3D